MTDPIRVDASIEGETMHVPNENAWDNFFLSDETASEDFLAERAEQHQPDREPL